MEKLTTLSQLMRNKIVLLSLLTISVIFVTIVAYAQEEVKERVLIPLGSDLSVTLPGFMDSALSRTQDNNLNILILPIGLASDPNAISSAERSRDLNQAGAFQSQIDQACQEFTNEGISCKVTLAPILTRNDATEIALKYFSEFLSAILILDGDHIIARQVIGGTPLEQALDEAYQNGVIVAGMGDMGNLLSLTMIGDYNQGFSEQTAFNFGSTDIWNDAERHGLLFGINTAIIDHNFFFENRVGRLINAITIPGKPNIGLGIDANAGIKIVNGLEIESIFGNNPVMVLDAESYHSAHSVHYNGPTYTLSLRNILVQILPSGWSYNLDSQLTSLGSPPERISRTFNEISLPQGSGQLIVSGDLGESLVGNIILERFVKSSKKYDGDILILPVGYTSEREAEVIYRLYAENLDSPSQLLLPYEITGSYPDLPDDVSGIIIVGDDQSVVQIGELSPLKDLWLNGVPVLAINAGAAIIGESYLANGSTQTQISEREVSIQEFFIPELVKTMSGLGFINVSFETKLVSDNRWSYLISLAHKNPNVLSIGLSDLTAIEISEKGPVVIGENIIAVLDLRNANLQIGENDRLFIGNGLLDIFSLGDKVQPVDADMSSVPDQLSTPELPTATIAGFIVITPTPVPSATPTIEPTKGPTPTRIRKPTATPLTIPPPADPGTSNLMVFFGLLIAIVIIFGITLNYRRIIPKSKRTEVRNDRT